MQPQFNSLDEEAGLEILDPMEGKRLVFYTSESVTPMETKTEWCHYPVSSACKITTSEIRFPRSIITIVRDGVDGGYLEEVDTPSTSTFQKRTYLIELENAVKMYLRTNAAFEITKRTKYMNITFDGSVDIYVGVRSHHSSPSETITVPDDPEALMDAISVFGSALKTTSCERSWPTLRGHPPRIKRGDVLSIPDDLMAPQSSVRLHVPAKYEYLYPVTPLAYYLGAEVHSGGPPRLTTENGFVHRFDTDRGVTEEIIRVLKQVFLFDCVVRTEGYDQSELHQRTVVEAREGIGFDFQTLYDASLAEQVERYLSIPYAAIEDVVPTWARSVHLRPDAHALELLPYIANDLSLVRPEVPRETTEKPRDQRHKKQAIATFKRSNHSKNEVPMSNEHRRDSEQSKGPHGGSSSEQYVPLPEVDTKEQAWIGEEIPERGAKLIEEAFERERTEPKDSTFRVTVVCNDMEMVAEKEKVLERYGRQDVISFDAEFHTNVSTDELRELLADDTDLFHYIGHIDGRGFECSDGVFDAETLDATGASAVLLNACRSYEQGVSLVECGANAVVVSLGDVENRAAANVGEKFAGLLNYGFTVGNALEVVIENTSIGRQYIVVGDPGLSVAQIRSSVPALIQFTTNRDGTTDVSHQMYTNRRARTQMGSMTVSYFIKQGIYYLVPAKIEETVCERHEIEPNILDTAPVVEDGTFAWY